MSLYNGEKRNKLIQSLLKIIFKIVNQTRKLPYIKTIFFFQTQESFEFLSISRSLSDKVYNNLLSRYNFANVPERNLILNNHVINLKKNEDSYELYNSLCKEVEEYFSINTQSPIFKTKCFVATEGNKQLITTNYSTKLEGELYRFVQHPLIVFPKICEFLTSSIFKEIFQTANPDTALARHPDGSG